MYGTWGGREITRNLRENYLTPIVVWSGQGFPASFPNFWLGWNHVHKVSENIQKGSFVADVGLWTATSATPTIT